MKGVDIVVIAIMALVIFWAAITIRLGIKRYRQGMRDFHPKMFFSKVPEHEASGTYLILEAFIGLLITISGGLFLLKESLF